MHVRCMWTLSREGRGSWRFWPHNKSVINYFIGSAQCSNVQIRPIFSLHKCRWGILQCGLHMTVKPGSGGPRQQKHLQWFPNKSRFTIVNLWLIVRFERIQSTYDFLVFKKSYMDLLSLRWACIIYKLVLVKIVKSIDTTAKLQVEKWTLRRINYELRASI
jgi:hypothetical protein